MANLLVGALQPGAREFGIGVTKPRRGVANFNGVLRGVIVKTCSPNELAAECFCALLANTLSVDAPDCGIVFENGTPYFASIDVASPNLMQNFCVDPDNPNNAELRALVTELVQWIGFGRLIALDVLVRNADRHPGNLLTDGADYWAIDHGRTLGLHPYTGHKAYQLVQHFADPLVAASIEAGAISNALTFPGDCTNLAETEVSGHALIAAFAQPFAQQVAARVPSLATSIQGLL